MKRVFIFVMTDDLTMMNPIQLYARGRVLTGKKVKSYAREHFCKAEILYNLLRYSVLFRPICKHRICNYLQLNVTHSLLILKH